MRIGVVYPQTEFTPDPVAIRDFAQTAEELGYTHILAYDHVLGANPERPGGWSGPYTHQDPFMEPFVFFSYLAAITQRIEFTTGIIILPQRQTALVAKQAATLDVLCGGRLRLGVGIGWNRVEYEALNENFHTRGQRSAEQVELMRRLWTEPLVNFDGRWHRVADAGLNPLPVQRPIPIWFGGHAHAVLQRVAQVGDGWMPNFRTPDDAVQALASLDVHLAAAGRTRADIGIEPRLHYGRGAPEEWRQIIDAWVAAGATHMTLNTMRLGFAAPDVHIAAMERFAHAIFKK